MCPTTTRSMWFCEMIDCNSSHTTPLLTIDSCSIRSSEPLSTNCCSSCSKSLLAAPDAASRASGPVGYSRSPRRREPGKTWLHSVEQLQVRAPKVVGMHPKNRLLPTPISKKTAHVPLRTTCLFRILPWRRTLFRPRNRSNQLQTATNRGRLLSFLRTHVQHTRLRPPDPMSLIMRTRGRVSAARRFRRSVPCKSARRWEVKFSNSLANSLLVMLISNSLCLGRCSFRSLVSLSTFREAPGTDMTESHSLWMCRPPANPVVGKCMVLVGFFAMTQIAQCRVSGSALIRAAGVVA